MSDFETRLTEALASGAEDAPGSDRLAAGARTRARRRRRPRYATLAGVVVLVIAVPIGVLTLNGDSSSQQGRVATDPSDHSYGVEGWQTVEHEGVLVDVPGEWDCSPGRQKGQVCTRAKDSLIFFGSALFDPAHGPGLFAGPDDEWSGYVYTGGWVVSVRSQKEAVGRRILASARTEGQDAPDLSAGFRTVSHDGLSVDVPADWQDGGLSAWCTDESVPGWVEGSTTPVPLIGCHPVNGYGVRFDAGDVNERIRERGEPRYPEHSWAGVAVVPDETGTPIGHVQIVAPTQGLAELIGGSLRVQ